jgi:hypothetical protein
MTELILHLPGLERSSVSLLPEALTDVLQGAAYAAPDCGKPLERVLGCGYVPPPAALSALGSGIDPGDRHWLRFDVVRMIPDLTAVWIERPLAFDFDAPACADLARELSELLESEGLNDYVHLCGSFGLIALPAPPDCRFTALDAAQGGRLDERLPEGVDAPRWRRMITASQMLFHRYRALDRADQSGAGLWFWGAGAVDRSPAAGFPALHVTDDFDSAGLRGLARWLDAEQLSAEHRSDGKWPERLLAALPVEIADPGEALRVLVDQWLQPGLKALGNGSLSRLTVVGSKGIWRLGRMHRFAFWRRGIRGLRDGGQR